MKFYSENLKRLFDSEKELLDAEEKAQKEADEREALVKKEKEERSSAAKAVEEAYREYQEAGKKYNKLLNEFLDKYHYYHQTVKENVVDVPSLFDWFFKDWPF